MPAAAPIDEATSHDSIDAAHHPVRVAVANDYEVVVVGLAEALRPYADRVQIIGCFVGSAPPTGADVILFDAFAQDQEPREVSRFSEEQQARLIVYSWCAGESEARRILTRGARGFVSKTTPVAALVEAIERVHAGDTVLLLAGDAAALGAWPGRDTGLSSREAEVLALIARGLANPEICERLHVSPNTLKTYIRTLYRKLGVTRRAQAVRWAMTHGFQNEQDQSTNHHLS